MNKEFLKGFAAGFATSETVRVAIKLVKKSIKTAMTEVEKTVSEYEETAEVDPVESSGDETLDPA